MAPKNQDYLEQAYQRMAEKKTHVSFPQLKYPSLRDVGMKHPVQWLEGKSMDDGAQGLWRVHDGIYDLSEFVKKHPGGAEWLELTKGTDITEAFECHHIGDTALSYLKNYFVKQADTPRNSPFTFKDDGFYRTLKRAVKDKLKDIPKDVGNKSNAIIDGLLVTCLFASSMACYLKNYWIVMFFYLVASVALAWVVVASHNYIHRRNNWRMYLFNIGLWSYRDFRVSHVLSHHVFPNTLMDLEVSAFEPLVWWNPRKDVPIYANFAFLIEMVVFPFAFLVNYLKRLVMIFSHDGFYSQHYHWHDNLGLLLPIWMYIISDCTPFEAIYMWFWILCTGSFVFFSIGSNAAHHHPKIFKDGDEIIDVTPDWGMHELEAVMDRTDISGNLFKVMTFFGDHALHHLFPTLDHAVLAELYPVFLKHVNKFKANFRMTSSLDLFIGQIQMTLKQEPRLLAD